METDCNAKWNNEHGAVHTCGLDKGHDGPCRCWLCSATRIAKPVTDRIEREKA